MRIWFKCKTNKDYVMINTAEFVLPNNTALTIDRTQTEYGIDENGILNMTWGGCYLWAVNGYTLFNDEAYITDYQPVVKGIMGLNTQVKAVQRRIGFIDAAQIGAVY